MDQCAKFSQDTIDCPQVPSRPPDPPNNHHTRSCCPQTSHHCQTCRPEGIGKIQSMVSDLMLRIRTMIQQPSQPESQSNMVAWMNPVHDFAKLPMGAQLSALASPLLASHTGPTTDTTGKDQQDLCNEPKQDTHLHPWTALPKFEPEPIAMSPACKMSKDWMRDQAKAQSQIQNAPDIKMI